MGRNTFQRRRGRVLERFKEPLRKVSNLAIRTLVNIGKQEVVREASSAIIDLISDSSPEQILGLADENGSLLDMANEDWNTRITKLVNITHKFHKEADVLSKLNEITLAAVLAEVYRMAAEDENDQCIDNLTFISNSKTCLLWLQLNINDVKDEIRHRLSE